MPRITRSLQAGNAFPASLGVGEGAGVLVAAKATLRRLRVVPPVGSMGLRRLREHVCTVHAAHRSKGGKLGLPELKALTRAELEDLLRRMKGVRAL